jgi:cation transport ATPase
MRTIRHRSSPRPEPAIARLLDAASIAVTAFTGHPGTAAASVGLGALARLWRESLLDEQDRLFAGMVHEPAATQAVKRGKRWTRRPTAALVPGDRIRLRRGDVVPADVLVTSRAGASRRMPAGEVMRSAVAEVIVERAPEQSRVARLARHVRHALSAREVRGALTPDLDRMLALPLTAAGLVLAITKDAGRTAALLQADPEHGIALAQPVAREAALNAIARDGVLLSGLDALDRLAAASAFAFEDIGVLAEPYWHVERIERRRNGLADDAVTALLDHLLGRLPGEVAGAGYPDAAVGAWRLHGAAIRQGRRTFHVGGADLLRRTWGIALKEPDRSILVRRLGIVEDGRCVAVAHLGARLRPDIAGRFAALRKLGVSRIAIFTEDVTERPPEALTRLDPEVEVIGRRSRQSAWLEEASLAGEQVALVHDSLRDLLPPGGLGLCPVDADAGSHGVLLGDPLEALVRGRATALRLRGLLRLIFGAAVAVDAAAMFTAALKLAPPLATTTARHAATFMLLAASASLARLAPVPNSETARGE